MSEYTPQRRLSLGQQIHGYVANRAEKMGGGGRSRGSSLNIRWGARFTPPKNTTTKIRLVPGAYKGLDGQENVYFQYISFYSARTNRGFVSSGQWELVDGLPNKIGGNCLGYDEWMREIEEGIDKNHRTISMRVMHAFNAIHLEWFHFVPVVDDQGRPIVYERGKKKGEQIVNKEQCEGRKCQYCKGGLEKTFGKKVHWSIGTGHLQQLGGIIDDIAKDCSNCDSSGSIETLTYDCEGCGKVIVATEDFDLKDEKQAQEYFKIIGNIYRCKCGYEGPLMPQYECSGCKDPDPLSIFDTDIEIKRQGDGAQSTIQVPRWKKTELNDELNEMATPWPLGEIFAADPLDIQAKALKVKNPYGGGSEDHARDYGKANYNK